MNDDSEHAQRQKQLAQYLLDIGTDVYQKVSILTVVSTHFMLTNFCTFSRSSDYIYLEYVKCFRGSNTDNILSIIYPGLERDNMQSAGYLAERAILTPKNDVVDRMNRNATARFPGDYVEYLSADSIVKCRQNYEACANPNSQAPVDHNNEVPVDSLNSLTPSS